MTVDLHKWTFADREALMALCNDVDRTYLSDRLPYPYTEADADWWLGMVAANEGKEGVWRAIVVDGQVVGSISVERMANEQRNAGSIGYTNCYPLGVGGRRYLIYIGKQFHYLSVFISNNFRKNFSTISGFLYLCIQRHRIWIHTNPE